MNVARTHYQSTGTRRASLVARVVAAVSLTGCLVANSARADTLLLSETSLVAGSQASVFAFQAPGAGTVSAQVTNVNWPQLLSSLSFIATSSSQTMASWFDPPSQTSQTLSFHVTGPGNYFADIFAVAGGPLDLGVYSFCIRFAPSAPPVALPATRGLMLSALAALLAWLRRGRAALASASGHALTS
jgi:hypothetical protein